VLSAAVGMAGVARGDLVPALQATRVPPSPAMRPGLDRECGAQAPLAAGDRSRGSRWSWPRSRREPSGRTVFPLFGFAAVALVVAALALAAPALVKSPRPSSDG
jgi:hypothetical protein